MLMKAPWQALGDALTSLVEKGIAGNNVRIQQHTVELPIFLNLGYSRTRLSWRP